MGAIPPPMPTMTNHGVPVFLDELIDAMDLNAPIGTADLRVLHRRHAVTNTTKPEEDV